MHVGKYKILQEKLLTKKILRTFKISVREAVNMTIRSEGRLFSSLCRSELWARCK